MSDKHEDGALEDMAKQAQELANAVLGHRISNVQETTGRWGEKGLALTLDTGRTVTMLTTSDCCAHSELEKFLFNPDAIDHVITKVITDDEYEKWYIIADLHQVMALSLDWGEGNYPYYTFGFEIEVTG